MTRDFATKTEIPYAVELMAWAVSTEEHISRDEWHNASIRRWSTAQQVAGVVYNTLRNAPYHQAVSLLPTLHGNYYVVVDLSQDLDGFAHTLKVFAGANHPTEYSLAFEHALFDIPRSEPALMLELAIETVFAAVQYLIEESMPMRFWCLPDKDHPRPL